MPQLKVVNIKFFSHSFTVLNIGKVTKFIKPTHETYSSNDLTQIVKPLGIKLATLSVWNNIMLHYIKFSTVAYHDS